MESLLKLPIGREPQSVTTPIILIVCGLDIEMGCEQGTSNSRAECAERLLLHGVKNVFKIVQTAAAEIILSLE